MDKKQNPNPESALNFFVEKLFEEKNYQNLDQETAKQMKADLLDRVQDRINVAMLASIPPERVEFFEKLLQRGDSAEVQAFCQRNIPDLDNVVARELIEFRKTYLNI